MQMIINSPKYGEKVIFFDVQDEQLINSYKWHICFFGKIFYASAHIYRDQKRTAILMHRLIMNPGNKLIDHQDGNGLNNKKSNLRLCNHSQNIANVINQKKSTSKYLGVSKYISGNWHKWLAQIQKNGKKICIGYFDNEKDAAEAYNEKAIIHHGEFARLNIISK